MAGAGFETRVPGVFAIGAVRQGFAGDIGAAAREAATVVERIRSMAA